LKMLRKKKNEMSRREAKSKEIASLERERDELIEHRRAILGEINTITPTEVGGRLKGMRLQAQADATQEYIHRQYEKIAKALLQLAEIEKQARYIKREYHITATGNRHLKAEGRKAEIQRTLKELEPARKDGNTNVEKLCAGMEAEYNAIDERCESELRENAMRYLALMGVPVDSNGDGAADELDDVPTMDYSNIHGRPRSSVRIDRGRQYS
jgi:hypothetical protein